MTPENGTRCLITGGAGFIGSNVTAALLAAGHEVTVLDDLSSGFRKNLQADPRLTFVEGDVRDRKAVRRAMAGASWAFHLAASVGNKRSIDDPFHDAEVNVLGTLNVLEEVRRAGAGRLVVSSSAGIFGELKTLPIREDHPVEPDTPYGSTKLCEEKLSLSYAKLYGFGVVCLRYFNVYGPNQRFDAYGNVIPIFVFKLLRGEPLTIFGDGKQTRDFVNVRDVVQANLKAAAADGVTGAFNIGSGTRISVNDLVRRIEAASGRRVAVGHGPPRAGDVRDSLADIGAARSRLGFEPAVGLDDGLPEYVRWAEAEIAS
jgi:nucleoside-diphosphate-sugar epimerase